MKKATLRDRSKARGWLVEHNIKQVQIKDALRQRSLAQVNETLQGTRNDRRVLQYLLDMKCPAEYLALPLDMQKDAA